MTETQYFEQFIGDMDDTPAPIVFEITTEYADEPTCNRQEWFTGVPTGYSYLAPILEAPDFQQLQFTVDLTRVTIRQLGY